MSSPLPPEVITTIQNGILNKYFVIAAQAILFYDYGLMFTAEIQHIWLSKWGLGNILYVLTRYLAFIESPLMILYAFNVGFGYSPNAETLCRHVYKIGAWVNLWGIVVACNILYLRTAAIWGWTKQALMCVAITDAIIIPLACYGMVSYLASMTYVPSPVPKIFPCNVNFTKNKIYLDYIEVLVIEICVFVLTVYKRLTTWPENPTPLLRTLYRDAVLFFGCLCTISIINLVLFTTPSLVEFYQLLVQLQYILHSVTTARIILHLRIAGSKLNANDGSVLLSDEYMNHNKVSFASPSGSGDRDAGIGSGTRSGSSGEVEGTSSTEDNINVDIELQFVGATEGQSASQGEGNTYYVVDPYMI